MNYSDLDNEKIFTENEYVIKMSNQMNIINENSNLDSKINDLKVKICPHDILNFENNMIVATSNDQQHEKLNNKSSKQSHLKIIYEQKRTQLENLKVLTNNNQNESHSVKKNLDDKIDNNIHKKITTNMINAILEYNEKIKAENSKQNELEYQKKKALAKLNEARTTKNESLQFDDEKVNRINKQKQKYIEEIKMQSDYQKFQTD